MYSLSSAKLFMPDHVVTWHKLLLFKYYQVSKTSICEDLCVLNRYIYTHKKKQTKYESAALFQIIIVQININICLDGVAHCAYVWIRPNDFESITHVLLLCDQHAYITHFTKVFDCNYIQVCCRNAIVYRSASFKVSMNEFTFVHPMVFIGIS